MTQPNARMLLAVIALMTFSITSVKAYFPPFDPPIVTPIPPVVIPPIVPQVVPPDPFEPPVVNNLGDPEPEDPDFKPVVNTPEPASVISGAMGLGILAIWRFRKRNHRSPSISSESR